MFHLTNQILHLMKNTFQIRQCEERRCRSPKYVRERKKDQELEKTESEDTDSDSITEDNKTGKRRSRSQQRRRDKGKSTKPKIVSSKLTYRKKYSKPKTKSYLTS